MNIFVFHEDINKNVKMYCDKHVVKMLTETMQILCTTYRLLNNVSEAENNILFKATHKNHPCCVWARKSYGNYKYLIELFYALHDEWNYRYGHDKIYKNLDAIFILESLDNSKFLLQSKTKHIQCFDDKYKCENPIEGYRKYFVNEKRRLFSWKNRDIPNWIK